MLGVGLKPQHVEPEAWNVTVGQRIFVHGQDQQAHPMSVEHVELAGSVHAVLWPAGLGSVLQGYLEGWSCDDSRIWMGFLRVEIRLCAQLHHHRWAPQWGRGEATCTFVQLLSPHGWPGVLSCAKPPAEDPRNSGCFGLFSYWNESVLLVLKSFFLCSWDLGLKATISWVSLVRFHFGWPMFFWFYLYHFVSYIIEFISVNRKWTIDSCRTCHESIFKASAEFLGNNPSLSAWCMPGPLCFFLSLGGAISAWSYLGRNFRRKVVKPNSEWLVPDWRVLLFLCWATTRGQHKQFGIKMLGCEQLPGANGMKYFDITTSPLSVSWLTHLWVPCHKHFESSFLTIWNCFCVAAPLPWIKCLPPICQDFIRGTRPPSSLPSSPFPPPPPPSRQLQIAVGTAGPQPRAPDPSGHCRTSMLDRMSEDLPNMPERMSEDMPDRTSEDMPDRMPERMSEDMPDRMSEDMPRRMPERVSEDMPDRMPERMSEDMADRMSKDMPDRYARKNFRRYAR